MNRSLFLSWYGAFAAILVAAFLFWLQSIGAKIGSGPGSDTRFLLVTGWTAFGLMLLVTAYSLRKYIHKLGISPETKNPPKQEQLERAESRLNQLRQEIATGVVREKSDAQSIATRILKEEGVAKIARVEVRDAPPGKGVFILQVLPTEPLGRVSKWLHSHLYLGLASGVLVWLHGGNSFDSPMAIALNGLSYLVMITGIIGIFLFALGPSWLTAAEKGLSFEESFVIEKSLREKIEALRASLDDAQKVASTDLKILKSQRERVLEKLCLLSRIRFWMNAWKVLHIPASILLLAMILVHIFSVWKY